MSRRVIDHKMTSVHFKLFNLIAFLVVLIASLEAVTLQEFQQTLKIVVKTCQTTTKVPEELLQKVRNGDYIEDQAVKCYTHCFMEMFHLMKGTVGQFHVADKHTDYMIPSELFETTIKAFGHCENATKGINENCEAAYKMLQCFKADNLEFWFK